MSPHLIVIASGKLNYHASLPNMMAWASSFMIYVGGVLVQRNLEDAFLLACQIVALRFDQVAGYHGFSGSLSQFHWEEGGLTWFYPIDYGEGEGLLGEQ
jgi:hypothetical protein